MTESVQNREGLLVILSSPSGAGKSTLARRIIADDGAVAFSVSATTRPMRPGEEDGVHYHFVSQDRFTQLVGEGVFIEHAQVFDNFYGTSETAVRAQLAAGQDVVVEIDWQGARQVRERIPQTIPIFILPPSREVLQQRLTDRGTDNDEVISRRMAAADAEMSHYDDAEFLVINDDFDQALHELECIICAQGLTLTRQSEKFPDLIASIDALKA
jgi:guanylate kinase